MKAKNHLYMPIWCPDWSTDWLKRGWLPNKGNVIFTVLMIALTLWTQSAGAITLGATTADPTVTIPYQGSLIDASGDPVSGKQIMAFTLYNQPTGGSPLWTEHRLGTDSVQVDGGLFNVMLGSVAPLSQNVITENNVLYLGIIIGTGAEMTPRVQLGSVPYAVHAISVSNGSIGTSQLANGSVTPEKSEGFVTTIGGNLKIQYGYRTQISDTSAIITFPEPFSSRPTVLATADTTGHQAVTVLNLRNDEFRVKVPELGGNIAINWIAIGPE